MSVIKGANIVPHNVGRSAIWSERYDLPKTETNERVCLKCDEKFSSKSKFNRICEHCKRMKEHAE